MSDYMDDKYYYFSDQYLTYRKLRTSSENWERYEKNNAKLNGVKPCSDFLYSELDVFPLTCAESDAYTRINTQLITENDNWPALVQFPEQIACLPNNTLYIVETDMVYWQQFFVKGEMPDLDVTVKEMYMPIIVDISVYCESDKLMQPCTIAELENLELQRDIMGYRLTERNCREEYFIPVKLCNLLPDTSFTCYSACFYDKYVAEMYAKSVCRFIENTYKRYTTSRTYY